MRSRWSRPSGSRASRRGNKPGCHRRAVSLVLGCATDEKEPQMRIFVAGATGAIGRQLVPRLIASGHEVVGMTRTESKQAALREIRAEAVVADALDPDQVAEAVATAKPEVLVHELTAISALNLRHFDRDFGPTNRLRTQGTDYL